MMKQFSLPSNLLKGKMDAFDNEVISYLEFNTPTVLSFNFADVKIVVSYSINKLIRLIKTASLLGIEVHLLEMPSHLALPMSQLLDSVRNVKITKKHDTEKRSTDYSIFDSIQKSESIDLLSRIQSESKKESDVYFDLIQDQKKHSDDFELLMSKEDSALVEFIAHHLMREKGSNSSRIDVGSEDVTFNNV